MEPLPVDVFQLQRRDPTAWTALLSRVPELADVIVVAVTAEPLWETGLIAPGRTTATPSRGVRRYILNLAGCSDPITFIAKQTNAAEAFLYQMYGDPPATGLPACYYAHVDGDHSWIILDDIANDFPPLVWQPQHVHEVTTTLARIHAAHWMTTTPDDLPIIPHFLHRPEGPYAWEELRQDQIALFEQGPGAVLSHHAIRNAGRLAPALLRAANGLVVMRELGGWPGVLGESHLAAAADLLDDPVPLLATLDDLSWTLLHGAPHPEHWRLTLFDEEYLIDWSGVQFGPGVLDLVTFLERYPLLYDHRGKATEQEDQPRLRLRETSPLFEETVTDTYLLTLAAELGNRVSARAVRAAIPAARCLNVLTTWFPFFAELAGDMPGRYIWQKINRLSEAELARYHDGPMAGMRPYLAGVFARFLNAYRSL